MISYGMLSTYPPTRCGLATFAEALTDVLPNATDPAVDVVRVDDLIPTGPVAPAPHRRVVADLRPGDADDRRRAAEALNSCDVVIVQHEYGIYGGRDGDEILDLLGLVSAPCIVTLHTVRESPTARQRSILVRLAVLASAVVVMTRAAADLLVDEYRVAPGMIHVVPHGVAPHGPAAAVARSDRPLVVTWGLLGPGKGIEWGIRALAEMPVSSRPRYLVAGQTHPKVFAESGERYRRSLVDLVSSLGLEDDVVFDGRYRNPQELAELVASADVVLLPYDSTEQTTSGVLVEAVAAGKPVVATLFPHAVELLGHGRGVLVEQRNAWQIAAALGAVLGRGREASPRPVAAEENDTSWPTVARQYRHLAAQLLREHAA